MVTEILIVESTNIEIMNIENTEIIEITEKMNTGKRKKKTFVDFLFTFLCSSRYSDRHRSSRSRSRHRSSRYRSSSRDRSRRYRRSVSRDRRHRRSSSREYRRSSSRRRSKSPRRRSPSPVRRRGGRSPSPPVPEEDRDRRTVFVTQLAARLRTRELEEFFLQAGKVREAKIIMDRNSRKSKG